LPMCANRPSRQGASRPQPTGRAGELPKAGAERAGTCENVCVTMSSGIRDLCQNCRCCHFRVSFACPLGISHPGRARPAATHAASRRNLNIHGGDPCVFP